MKALQFVRYGKPVAIVVAFVAVAWMGWKPVHRPKEHKVATLAHLPLSFELNRGQAAAEAKFVVRAAGYALLLTDRGEPVLALHGQPRRPALQRAQRQRPAVRDGESARSPEGALLRLEFPGGNPSPQVGGEQPLPGRTNYLIGNDPKKWLIGVPHFSRVRYGDVFPGVDVLYYARDQYLEYDFIVRPGTSPDSIRLAVKGTLGIEQTELGNLVLRTAAGRVLLHKPVAFQQGPGGERKVACAYVLDQNGGVGFALGDYDRSQVLRIDPALSYAARLDALLQAVAVDASGNSYVAGHTFSASFPITPGVFQPAHGGNADALIAKLDPTGSTLLFATYLGGSQDESASGIALDSNGNVILAGWTRSPNFPVNNAVKSTFSGGGMDAFLSKLNPTGTQLLYSTYLGGAADDAANGVGLDANDRVLITGVTNSSAFPVSMGAFQTTLGGNRDAFVTKLDTTLIGAASLLFSTYLGGSNEELGTAIAVDGAGDAFVTGPTSSMNFPTANPIQPSCASCAGGQSDAFVTKLNANGTALVYSTYLGGSSYDSGLAIALDSLGNAYVAGETDSSDFPTTMGAFQTSYHGALDAFVTKLDSAGSARVYSTFVGGSGSDGARGIAVDGARNAYLTGFTNSGDFPTASLLQGNNGVDCTYFYYGYPYAYRCTDAVVPQLNTTGSMLVYSTYLGGAGANDFGAGIAVDAIGNAYVVGSAGGSTFPFTQGALRMSGGEGFAAKISPQNTPGFSFDTQQVSFGLQSVGTTSGARNVLLRNMGSSPLNFSSISTSGDFAQTNNCGSSVAGGSNCTVQLTFAPTTVGPQNGMLIVNDDAAGSPHSLSLSGTGVQATNTALASSLNPSMFGQAVTFTATVTPLGATGTVNFRDTSTGNSLGSDLLDANGTASVITNTLSAGNHSIVADYLGDATFGSSASVALLQTVNPVATTTTLASSTNPSNQGQSVMFTATVTPVGATGQVAFRDGNTTFGTASLNASGMATFSTTSLSGGNHSVTAAYAGDGNFLSSTSPALNQVVNSISLMAAQNSATVSRQGGTATFMLSVSQAGALNAPISFSCAGLRAGWNCTFAPNSVPAGSGVTTVTLTLQVPNMSAQNMPQFPEGNRELPGTTWLWILALLTLGIPAVAGRCKASWRRAAALAGLAVLLLFAAGCGSGGPPPPQTVTVTVNATSGSTTTSTTLAVTVQ